MTRSFGAAAGASSDAALPCIFSPSPHTPASLPILLDCTIISLGLAVFSVLHSTFSPAIRCPPTMDTLVARYSGSAFRDDLYSEEQQRDLTECLPPLSLKFELPPVAKVSL